MAIRLSIRNLFRFITILIYLKPIRPFTYNEQGNIRHEDGIGLIPDTISNREVRFLGETPGDMLIKSLSVVSALFTIWIFSETRNKQREKHVEDLLEDLTLQLENLNFRLEDVKNSQLQLTCIFNAVQAQPRNKGASRECLQFPQERKQVAASHFGKTFPLHNQ